MTTPVERGEIAAAIDDGIRAAIDQHAKRGGMSTTVTHRGDGVTRVTVVVDYVIGEDEWTA